MTPFFTYEEGSLLVRLLIAHFITDFLLQPGKWVQGKNAKSWQSQYFWYHGLLTGAIAWLFLGNLQYLWAIAIITVSHLLIDAGKIAFSKKLNGENRTGLILFLSDQLLHVMVIAVVWLWMIHGWHRMVLLAERLLPDYRILLRLLGYILMVGPVGFVIQFLTKKWLDELKPSDSLRNAGKWIGILERVLTLTFVFTNQFSAIGFLIAAKSVLRVTDKPDKPNSEPTLLKPFSSRKHTEYVLIGTFWSFAIAILTGLIINWLLSV